MRFSLGFVTFIAANPGFVAWLLGGLVSTLALLIIGAYKLIYEQIGDLKRVDSDLERRVGSVESRITALEPNVGAGERALNLLTARIEKHMTEEEAQVWTGIRALGDKLNEIQVENVEAHAKIVTEYGERLAKIETRMENISSKMPNGQINEMLSLLKKLATS
jgi:uncharacterized coiled-coil protein SlyX